MNNELMVVDVISSEKLPIVKASNEQISRYLTNIDQKIKSLSAIKEGIKQYAMLNRYGGEGKFEDWEVRQSLKRTFDKDKAPVKIIKEYTGLKKQEKEIKEKLKAIETLYGIENVTYSWYPPKY